MIGFGENDLSIAGGTIAVNVATADPVAPVFVPPSVDVMNPLTLVCGPAVVAVTFTLTVHEPPAGMLAGVVWPKLSVVAPAPGAQEGPPAHVVAAAGVAATCRPAGNLSTNLTPFSVAEPRLASVNCSVDVPLTAIGSVRKLLVIVGG